MLHPWVNEDDIYSTTYSLTFYIYDTGKQLLWQTAKIQMKSRVKFLTIFRVINYQILEISTCDPFPYLGYSIRMKMVKESVKCSLENLTYMSYILNSNKNA